MPILDILRFMPAIEARAPKPPEALEPEDDNTLSDILSAARQQPDTAKSARLLNKAEQYIIDQYIALPLFCSPSLFSLGDGINGVYYNDINGTVYFADAVCTRG